jgi:hypothetical protein
VQVFSASRTELIHPFTGLHPAQFHRLVRVVAKRGGVTIADGWPGRPWALTLYRTSGINQKLAGREVMADGTYRGNPEVIIPYRKPGDEGELPAWKQD